MFSEDFGDGGAFAEIHIPQYPLGLGRRASKETLLNNSSSISSRLIESALVVKTASASQLVGASKAEIDDNVQRTRQAIQQKLEEHSSNVGNLSQRSDPLDPRLKSGVVDATNARRARGGEVVVQVVADPAPIIRSPTKKPRNKEEESAQKELTSVPFCVSSWTNKKNLVIALEDRVASAHEETDAPQLGANHISLAQALNKAKKDVGNQQALEEKMQREVQEQKQAEIEGSALQEAQTLLEAMEKQRVAQQANESREERHNRLRLEREQRERERAVKAKLRRHQDAAARLGITVEALEADAELLRSVDNSAGNRGDDVTDLVDARVIQEASRVHRDDDNGDSSAAPGISQKDLHVSTRGIESEMKILEAAAASDSAEGVRKRVRDDSDDDDDDSETEDLFGVADILQRNGGRAQKKA